MLPIYRIYSPLMVASVGGWLENLPGAICIDIVQINSGVKAFHPPSGVFSVMYLPLCGVPVLCGRTSCLSSSGMLSWMTQTSHPFATQYKFIALKFWRLYCLVMMAILQKFFHDQQMLNIDWKKKKKRKKG